MTKELQLTKINQYIYLDNSAENRAVQWLVNYYCPWAVPVWSLCGHYVATVWFITVLG